MNNYELTVKHISANGEVSLYPTTKVRLHHGIIEFPQRPDEMVVTVLNDGDVYVMNSSGKTVMNHSFGGPVSHQPL